MAKKDKETDEEEEEEISEESVKKTNGKEPQLTDLPGIGPAVAAKLEGAGIFDLMGLAVMGPAELSDAAGVSPAVARKAIQAARGMLDLGFQTGVDFAKKRESVSYITTGSKNLNELLGGKGVESKAITEAFGAYGSGKCISKDTEVSYLNDTKMHIETIEETYNKYNYGNEKRFEEGFVVPVSTVKVFSFVDGKLKIVKSSHLYKEKVKNLFVIKTKRGRVLKITGKHKLLSFDNCPAWKDSCLLKKGDIIAYPKIIEMENTEKVYNEDDAYFLGLFVAEGTFNPFSLSNTSEVLKDWVVSYIKNRFGYSPTVRTDNRREKPVYTILLRKDTRKIMEGLDKCNSENKFIPENIFLSDKEIILSFLSGYFEGDAEISKKDISATTKSKRLATQLTYLLLRVGISSTLSEKIVDDKIFKIVRICGEDRKKLKKIKFKTKKFDCNIKNSSYGYPCKIVSYIRELYKESIGGNRGKQKKIIGKENRNMAYDHLTRNSFTKVINSNTFNEVKDIFTSQKELLKDILNKIENCFSDEILREVYSKLPFAFNSLSDKMGIKKSSMRNYNLRIIPENRKEILRKALVDELKKKINKIELALNILNGVEEFNWDIIKSVDVVDYYDYVYDFVVPEGHSFVGGNMPTMMHNTQLSLTLAVNAQLPFEKGGVNGKVVFIDTEGTFRPSRIKQIAEAMGANSEKVLKNIFVARAFNSDHQILLIEKVSEMIKNGEPIKLVIVDSLTAHFRAEFAGRGQLADRQQRLNKYLHNLMKIAEQHNLAVYVTNQVMSNPAQLFGDPTVAIGGNIVGHACLTGDTKVALVDGRNLSFIELVKEHNQGKVNFTFTINKDNKIGIAEIKDPRLTRNNAEVMKVILDNGEEIKCTLDHKFMLRDGSYKEAQHLQFSDSLMPLYFKDTNKPILIPVLQKNTNHKVVRTKFLKEFTEVYDLTIDNTHNFALAAGIFVHNSTYRMYLRRGKQGSRVAKLIDSPNLPDNETIFYVTEAGVVDEI